MYLVLTPSKTVGRVPSQQGAPTTCNLTYWEVSKQTDREPLVQHDDIKGYAAYGVVCPHITGQLGCGYRAKFSPSLGGRGKRGQRVFRQIAQSSYSTHQIPSNTLNCLFPGNTFFPRTYCLFKISQPAKIRLKNRRTDIFRDRSIGCPCNLHSVISFCFSCFYYNKVN